jgi:hypothetical protein
MATKMVTAENKPATFETGERAVLMPALGGCWHPLYPNGRQHVDDGADGARRPVPRKSRRRPAVRARVDDLSAGEQPQIRSAVGVVRHRCGLLGIMP